MQIVENFGAPEGQRSYLGTGGNGPNVPPLLIQYWHTVMRWRWLMLSVILGCIILSVVVTLLMSPKYTAQTQIQIDRQQKQITMVEGIEAQTTPQDQEFYATQYTLLKARPLAERVAASLRLYNDEAFLAAHGIDGDVLTENAAGLSAQQLKEKNRQLIVNLLLDNVEIAPIRNSKLVNIRYTSRDPNLAARISNEWAAAFIATSMDRQYASTADARKFLEERLVTLRQRLDESEKLAVNYASQNSIVSLGEAKDGKGRTVTNQTLAGAQLAEMASALSEATTARIAAESRSASSGEATSESVTSNTLSNLRSQRSTIAAEYAKKRVQLEDRHPLVMELKQQLATTDSAIAQETQRITRARQSEYREAVRRESELQAKVEALKQSLDAENKANIQYAAYLRDADTNRQIYDALLQRFKEIGVAGQVGVNNISVVEPANMPTEPSSPNLLLNTLIATFVGLALAGAVAFGFEQIDEGVRDPNQVDAQLGLPLLGITPKVERNAVMEISDVKSALYDAYFSIHSNLAFSTSHGFPKSLAVTSTRPGEGKSSTSLALAVVLGRTGKSVLLIDGDLRSPSINFMLGIDNEKGLSNYLAGEDDWQSFVRTTELKNISVISAGRSPPSAAELLSGDRFATLIGHALEQYDHIVIDAPPVLGMTDAPLISKAAESVVYVVESSGPAVRGIRGSIHRLAMANVHLSGVVLSKVDEGTMSYGYGYGYGYAYGYGKGLEH